MSTLREKRAVPPPPPNVYAAQCPSRVVLDRLTSRWGVLVLVALLEGTHRFRELARKIGGVSEKMLSQTLQTLESEGFVVRTAYAEIPPRVEYSLTPLGTEAAERVRGLVDWIEANLPRVEKARAQLASKAAPRTRAASAAQRRP
ncbi:MAG TPA: helix-turn-helix domain-containing protein [Polyangiaceae bacterium]|jgi:DNA-binding HxlR family transcriptional regulator|nr:helix-turn-helix domain-containing protein [Polyangiaceae bacterium]